MMERYRTFREFYPFYLAEHVNPVSRRLHVVGATLAVLCSPRSQRSTALDPGGFADRLWLRLGRLLRGPHRAYRILERGRAQPCQGRREVFIVVAWLSGLVENLT